MCAQKQYEPYAFGIRHVRKTQLFATLRAATEVYNTIFTIGFTPFIHRPLNAAE